MMPVKNEEFTIKEKLENCFNLDYPVNKLQLLVMDSSSDDNTQNIVKSFKYK
jgi:cellulose synthase/poly-beta-1,6-N-acetylglucosamine synthase-like glycosyltransferase